MRAEETATPEAEEATAESEVRKEGEETPLARRVDFDARSSSGGSSGAAPTPSSVGSA